MACFSGLGQVGWPLRKLDVLDSCQHWIYLPHLCPFVAVLTCCAGLYPFVELGLRDNVATDSKITSYALHQTLCTQAIVGPTYDQQPVFKFSTSPFANASHVGMPDEYKFPWVTVTFRRD